MKKVLFNKSLTLVKVVEGYGFSNQNTETSLNVKGDISLPSLTLKTSVEGVGRKLKLSRKVMNIGLLGKLLSQILQVMFLKN